MPVYIANPEHCQECGYWHYTHKQDCSKYMRQVIVEPVSTDKTPTDSLRKELDELRAEVEAIKAYIRANGTPRKTTYGYWEES